MSRVFISYKRVDAARANVVRQKLDSLGVPLFIDAQIDAGQNFISIINEQLEAAAAVLVLWTEQSARLPRAPGESNFVIAEATRGLQRSILVAATLDRNVHQRLPVPFNMTQTADLSGWITTDSPAASHAQWQSVLDGLGRILNRPGLGRLAIVLEDGSEEAKCAFVRAYPQDPFADRLMGEIAEAMRRDFDDQMRKARERIEQQNEHAEEALSGCQRDFEGCMEKLRPELQAGREVWPPDPAAVNDDSVPALRTQIRINRDRAEKAEELAEQRAKELADAAVAKAALVQQASPPQRLYRSITLGVVILALFLGGFAPLLMSQSVPNDFARREQVLKEREDALNARLADKEFTEAVARCDELTSYYFDPDVPLGTTSVQNHTDIKIPQATPACERARQLAAEQPKHPESERIKRRLTLQMGRIYSGQAAVAAYNSDSQMAERLFGSALSHWRTAAESGSSQAFTVIGSYYSGAFVMKTDQGRLYNAPGIPDLKLAWDSYFRAATMGNPLGLVNTALVLTKIDARFNDVVPADEKLGRELLEGARRLGHRRAYYEMGFAIYRGRGGYERNAEQGLKLIGQAFCMHEQKAIDFYSANSLYTKPTCS